MVEADGLCMSYGPVVALADASFKAKKGEVLGLLGPNGAGKTTTMKILTTQIVPTAGQAKVAGFDILKEAIEVRRRVGYLPETPPLYPEMEVAEYLDFVGKARGLDGAALKQRVDYVVHACGLRTVYRTPVGTLSRGYGQRTGLAQALIHDPEVLILDEPTSGLDPIQIMGIRELIRAIAKDKTILFSTHILQEAQAISDRIVIITEGNIVADGTVEELEAKVSRGQRFSLTVKTAASDLKNALTGLKSRADIDFNITELSGYSKAMIETSSGTGIWEQLTELIHTNKWPVKEFTRKRASLEEAFRYYVKPRTKEKAA
ncbi:MAG TPA: MFS transporter [candidate division Zixibacteria bacterium]|nr:MFS transporter [candidate division Zixibacteria bacterium]HBZ02164.1 MFS transporter [candidate division Zixibacteria bacterium]